MEGSRNASPSSSVTTGHDVFLSHSCAQKEFVEQLYVDLKRARINAFFDEESLPKGEEFPEHLRREASTCKIAVAVLSEDFFTGSSWPMEEMITSVEAKTPVIYPLFYLISSKGVQDVEKQREWSAQWESWGMAERHNMGLEQWKAAVKKIGMTHGEEKPEYMSPVKYRKKIVVCIKKMLEIINEKIVSGIVVTRAETSRSTVVVDISETSSSGSSSGAEISRIATQPSNVVASSGSAGRRCGERFGVGLQVGLGVGVGQGIGLALLEGVLHLIDPPAKRPPSRQHGNDDDEDDEDLSLPRLLPSLRLPIPPNPTPAPFLSPPSSPPPPLPPLLADGLAARRKPKPIQFPPNL